MTQINAYRTALPTTLFRLLWINNFINDQGISSEMGRLGLKNGCEGDQIKVN